MFDIIKTAGLLAVIGFVCFVGLILFVLSLGEGGLGRIFATPEGDRRAKAEKVRVEAEALEKAKSLIADHLPALIRQRRLLVSKNAYGIENTRKWDLEAVEFMNSVIGPALNLEAERTFYLPEERARLLGLCEIEMRTAVDLGFVSATTVFATEYDPAMSPIEFEHFCAERLRMDGWDASVTQASADQGADIIARYGKRSVAVQCKQYSKPVGNSAVQEVVAARAHYATSHAAVIANIGFTPAARKLAETNGVHLLHHDEIGDLAALGPNAS